MYSNQTDIGKIFGIDSHSVGKYLTQLGLKVNNKPSNLALRAAIVKKSKVWLWEKDAIIKLFVQLGLKKVGAAKNNDRKMRKVNDKVIAYVDGGQNTYAVVLFDKNGKKHYVAGKDDKLKNNNQAELKAVEAALSILPDNEVVTVVTDSTFSRNVLKNIDSADNSLDIVARIKVLLASKNLKVKVTWVKSHTGLDANEEADALCRFVKTLTI